MSKSKRFIKGCGLFLLSVSWCAAQTALCCIFALCLLPLSRVQKYRGMIVLYHPFPFTFSLGTFAFISNGADHPREARGRMYGHYLQSLFYGPAFLFLAIIPQLFVRIPAVRRRRAERGIAPTDIFADRQSHLLAERVGE